MNWIKKNRFECFVILLILIFAAFLRFYKIDQYMTFLGDEGRDALVIQGILVNHHIPLLGPVTSVGNMYLGPLYYYMMAIPMAIFWLNPVAAAGMDAAIGVATVGLIYFFGRAWFGKKAAKVASLLYAVSPITIIYARSSWNPNPMPFFALLALFGLYKSRVTKNYLWFILVGVCLAFAVQMHYLALILLPIFGLLWLYQLVLIRKKITEAKFFFHGTIGAIFSFLFLMSPLALFDLRHNFMNLKNLKAFLAHGSTTFNIFDIFKNVIPIYNYNLIDRYMTGDNMVLRIIVGMILILPIIWLIKYRKSESEKTKWPVEVLGLWLIFGILGLSLYRQVIYDHYLGFVNPAPYLLLGSLFFVIPKVSKGLKKYSLEIPLYILVAILFVGNLMRSPLSYPPNNQLKRTQEVAQFVIQKSGNKPFNFALLSANNYDSAYQFYLGIYGHTPLQVPFNITDQLFVVCEDADCQPINNAKYEIAAFGWSKIVDVENFEGVKVYTLAHNNPLDQRMTSGMLREIQKNATMGSNLNKNI